MSDAPVEPRPLRPYQSHALDLLRQSLAKHSAALPDRRSRVVLHAPTGAGKTRMAAEMVRLALGRGRRVLLTAPQINLCEQMLSSLGSDGIDCVGVMQANHPRTDPGQPVQIASLATLVHREAPHADLVVVDEAHMRHAALDRLSETHTHAHWVGLTATPWAQGMGLMWDDVVSPVTLSQLIEEGWLVPPRVFAPFAPDLSRIRVQAGEYVTKATSEEMRKPKLVGDVVEHWLARGEDRPTLAFCVDRAHARAVHASFERAGVASAYVDGDCGPLERESIRQGFEGRSVRVIVSVLTMTTGVDLPSIRCLIDAAPTRSLMRHVQKIGRGLRAHPGKVDCLVFDHAGNHARLGLVTSANARELCKKPPGEKADPKPPEAEDGSRTCSKCSAVYTTEPACPVCGHVPAPPMREPETVDGELHEWGAPEPQLTPAQEKVDEWHGMLLALAHERDYKPGWAYHKTVEKFGPSVVKSITFTGEFLAPSAEVRSWVKSRQIRAAKQRAKEQAMK